MPLGYVGAGLPLMLLFALGEAPLGLTLSSEIVAEEVVRILVSSSGLILAIPLTTAITIFLLPKPSAPEN